MARGGKGRFVYGRHPVSEALRVRPRDVQRLYVASGGKSTRLSDLVRMAERHKIPVVDVAKRNLVDLVGEVPHQGVVAQVQAFEYVDVSELLAEANRQQAAPLLVACDQIQDPHNLGSIIRSTFAMGGHGIILPKDRAVEVTPTVVKSAAGATAHVKVARVTNLRRCLDELKQAGLWVVGTDVTGGQTLEEVDWMQPTVLVIGSEGKGLRRMVGESCDILAHIPMPGDLGSLNASVAAGICLYEAARQRLNS